MEDLFKETQLELEIKEKDLEVTTKDLEETQTYLKSTKVTLRHTTQDRDEQRHLVTKHVLTEGKLQAQANQVKKKEVFMFRLLPGFYLIIRIFNNNGAGGGLKNCLNNVAPFFGKSSIYKIIFF